MQANATQTWRYFLPRVLAALVLGTAAQAARAAEDASTYPSRTVTIVVGFTPGGATDITARLMASKLTQAFG